MTRKISIDPVTRVEGHGKVTIHLDEQNRVKESRFHIVEFRGFEKFIQGRPYWEAAVLVQRLCGICPVSHHLAAAKAIDEVVGVGLQIPKTATKMRRLMHYGQVLQSHALHFFYLAAPDLLLGVDASAQQRNVVGLIQEHKDLALRGIKLRKFGQEIIRATAGKKIHGISAVPGGIHKNLSLEERDFFLKGTEVPSPKTGLLWMEELLDFVKSYYTQHRSWLDQFSQFPSNHLSIVGNDGLLDLYHGRLRAIDADGKVILNDVDYHDYLDYFAEDIKTWTYLKFPYLKELGPEKGWSRVGPLARLNVCEAIGTPLAQKKLEEYRSFVGQRVVNHCLYYHWARLIEMVHCLEVIEDLLNDPDLQGDQLVAKGEQQASGIGVIEAPRGLLLHHYEVADTGEISRCNLIVSTTHNNEAMNRSVGYVAEQRLSGVAEITEPLINEIEVGIRAYDPCLSCATHAVGTMPLEVSLFGSEGLVDRKLRH